MSNLSDRVEKAKKLVFVGLEIKGGFGTEGSQNDPYQVFLSHSREEIITPDGKITIAVFGADCQKTGACRKMGTKWEWQTVNGERKHVEVPAVVESMTCDCKGNGHKTVCYHSLGAIHYSFKAVGKLVTFHETYEKALQGKNFGGYICKVKSENGQGFVWCVVRDWPVILSIKENVNLMRGSANDEGID